MLNGNEAKIFITTIQRFPLIYKEVVGTAGKNYAIIIDEAHSSQSGEASKALKKALADISELQTNCEAKSTQKNPKTC